MLRLTQITGTRCLTQGTHVVVVAGGHVDPAALAADAPGALGEVRPVRACRSAPAARSRRGRSRSGCGAGSARAACRRCSTSRPSLYFLASFCSCGVGFLERLPALDRVGQEARARGLQRPVEAFGDLDRGAPQHLRVELVGASLDFARDLVEQRRSARRGRSRRRRARPPWRTRRRCPVSQSISVPYTSKVTNVTFFGMGIAAALCPARMAPRRGPVPSQRRPFALESRAAMDLLEYQGKQLFARHGLRVSPGQARDDRRGRRAGGRARSATRSWSRRRC